jgi:hypothetical protein
MSVAGGAQYKLYVQFWLNRSTNRSLWKSERRYENNIKKRDEAIPATGRGDLWDC